MEILYRQKYIDQIEKHLGKDYIIVLVGQRRVGKSYTLKMIRRLKEQEANNNIIYVDKEKEQFDFIKTYQDLNEYIKSKYVQRKMNYILVVLIKSVRQISFHGFLRF